MAVTLILGGARSGKSAHAQRLAEAFPRPSGGRMAMIVTAEASDDEMADRIGRHRADRGPEWLTIEAPIDLASALANLQPRDVAVVDCLTIWLSNLMLREVSLAPAFRELVAALEATKAEIILVSNEVGLGIVPDNALARRFRDEAGRLHQSLAAHADTVLFIVAGLPIVIKPSSPLPVGAR